MSPYYTPERRAVAGRLQHGYRFGVVPEDRATISDTEATLATVRAPLRGVRSSARQLDLDPIRIVDGAEVALGRSTPSGTSHFDTLHHEADNGPAPL